MNLINKAFSFSYLGGHQSTLRLVGDKFNDASRTLLVDKMPLFKLCVPKAGDHLACIKYTHETRKNVLKNTGAQKEKKF